MQRALMTVLCGALTGSVMADVITVPAGGSIQSAIDQATAGDEIIVQPGVYAERLDLGGRAVHLRSLSGPGETIIDGSGLGGSVIVCDEDETPATRIEGFTITGGSGTFFLNEYHGGGIFIKVASPTIVNCDFLDNVAESGGGLSVFAGSPSIQDCRFVGNVATGTTGGGGMASNSATPVVVGCMFESNTTTFFGGGLNCLGGSPRITNCVFIGNDAAMGGAIRNSASSPHITNCTIIDNNAAQGGGIRSSSGGSPTVTNSIIWANTPESLLDLAGATSDVTHTLVEGGWVGAGNIDDDPRLVDGYRLLSESPCLDTGDNLAIPDGIETDIEGNDRITNAIVDMGAFEPPVLCPADVDGSGDVGWADLIAVLSSWGPCQECDADVDDSGDVTFADLTAVLSAWGGC